MTHAIETCTRNLGDHLWASKPSQYTSHLGQLSLPSFQDRLIEYQPYWLELRQGMFTCVGWQVTLCDPIGRWRPVALRWVSHEELYRLTCNLTCEIVACFLCGHVVGVASELTEGTVARVAAEQAGRVMERVSWSPMWKRKESDVTFFSLSHRRLRHTLHETRPVRPAVVKRLFSSAGFVPAAAAPRRHCSFSQLRGHAHYRHVRYAVITIYSITVSCVWIDLCRR